MTISIPINADEALARAKVLAREADEELDRAGTADARDRAVAKASVATSLATIVIAMRQ